MPTPLAAPPRIFFALGLVNADFNQGGVTAARAPVTLVPTVAAAAVAPVIPPVTALLDVLTQFRTEAEYFARAPPPVTAFVPAFAAVVIFSAAFAAFAATIAAFAAAFAP